MTSPAKIAANRRNAQKSTGPRTAAGKARSAQNARKHGLAVSVWSDPNARASIAALAAAIAGDEAGAERHDKASRIAAADAEIRRVRGARVQLFGAELDSSTVVERLERLARYERRAFSRRNFAIWNFEGMHFGRTKPPRRGEGDRILAERTQPASRRPRRP